MLPSTAPNLLDRELSRRARALLVAACAFIPTFYLAQQYRQRADLTRVISFGQIFETRELPEIRDLHPAIERGAGFDGQFYAQIALDPTCRRPDLPGALDNPSLRMQRILLPALAHVLGGGKPARVVFDYALLNLGFWYLLLAVLVRRHPATTPRRFLALFAIMLTTGTLISVQSALTDLPAVTLGFISLGLAELPAAAIISLAILTKPTCGLFLLRYLAPFPQTVRDAFQRVGLVLFALALPMLWQFYLVGTIKAKVLDSGQFGAPFTGWWHRWWSSIQTWGASPLPQTGEVLTWEWNVFEVLALISMTIQIIYLVLTPRWRHPLWLVSLAFIALFFCFSDKNFSAEVGYTRTVLPITIAFNLFLLEIRSTPRFLLLFLGGNFGLLEGAGDMLRLSF
jgi:hypothetical protein